MFRYYDKRKYSPTSGYEIPPPGKYTASIDSASHTYSKAGNPMLKLVFSLSGSSAKIHYYFVDTEYVQRKLDQFFNSFAIQPGNFDLETWIGRSGEVQIAHEESNGYTNAKIHYFHLREVSAAADSLPYFDEPGGFTNEHGVDVTDGDIPF